jgi:redox-sensitive bicupin YhaK (pirin superfamily)
VVNYTLDPGRYPYLVPARGAASANGEHLDAGDGVAAYGERQLEITAEADTEVVLVDAGPAPTDGQPT